ncbi:rhomboid family intramembrane serine protease [Dokdonia donghaensis]|uniref:Protease n=1 Tax=Dokdonia donghaensis DSW-1 TaxID=1300343 RepID=A0A0A2GSI9_9FLAO|nr:rhomboid family intramembrane serine protease [Dokdonia donghaensis]ANH61679.1 Rhomboid family protein [Dokdonia donghaensis DSW-1]KGO06269.1 protease [Dokdonia donghaensis DSW-1]
MANTSLAYKFKTANIAIKLIVVNVLVYVLFNIIPWLVGLGSGTFSQYFVLPSDVIRFLQQPWSVVTYAFLHSGFSHLLWNMVFLYVFSRFVLNLFSEKKFLAIYLLGAIAGGVLFALLYNVLPVFRGTGVLLGASAAVNAIVVFIGTYTPDAEVRIFTFNVKLWWIAAFIVVKDILLLDAGNAGGLISHLGGAAFGFYYAKQLLAGNDIGLWFERLIDNVSGWFTKKPKKQKKSPLRTVHKNKKSSVRSVKKTNTATKREQQQRIDAILDKISKSGYDSLSKAEKDFLFKAGKE